MGNFWGNIPFNRSEFRCKCGCGFDVVDAELLSILVDLRAAFGTTIISGGNRCVEHNEKVQRDYNGAYIPYSSKSYHTRGMAVDAKFPRANVKTVYDYLVSKYPDRFGFILYHNRIHIDVRKGKYRSKK